MQFQQHRILVGRPAAVDRLPRAASIRPGAASAASLGLLFLILCWPTLPSVGAGLSGQIGTRYGIWVAIIAGVVEVAAAVSQFRASGEALPWKPS